jgi:hypothetical protein
VELEDSHISFFYSPPKVMSFFLVFPISNSRLRYSSNISVDLLFTFAVLAKFALSVPSAESTSSQESWTLATQWLETCVSQHSRCNDRQRRGPWYPTRLVDIGESSAANVRLVVSSESLPDGPYVTLSYCWGLAKYLKLTTSCVSDLKQLIPLEELPRTFKESFEVTRRMGIRYI